MKPEEIKLLRISKTTWDKLCVHAKYGDTHNDIVLRLLELADLSKIPEDDLLKEIVNRNEDMKEIFGINKAYKTDK